MIKLVKFREFGRWMLRNISREVRKGHGSEGHVEFYGESVILWPLGAENKAVPYSCCF